MKKLTALLFLVVLIFTACGNSEEKGNIKELDLRTSEKVHYSRNSEEPKVNLSDEKGSIALSESVILNAYNQVFPHPIFTAEVLEVLSGESYTTKPVTITKSSDGDSNAIKDGLSDYLGIETESGIVVDSKVAEVEITFYTNDGRTVIIRQDTLEAVGKQIKTEQTVDDIEKNFDFAADMLKDSINKGTELIDKFSSPSPSPETTP